MKSLIARAASLFEHGFAHGTALDRAAAVTKTKVTGTLQPEASGADTPDKPRSRGRKKEAKAEPPPPPQVQVQVEQGDLKVIARLNGIENAFRMAVKRESKSLFEQGKILLPVRRERLYPALGMSSFGEYCVEILHIERRAGMTITDIAGAYSLEQYIALGFSRARAGLLLLRAMGESQTVTDLFTMTLRHGSGAGKPFVTATVREIMESVRGERGSTRKAPREHPPAVTALANALQRAAGATTEVAVRAVTSRDAPEPEIWFELRVPASRGRELVRRLGGTLPESD